MDRFVIELYSKKWQHKVIDLILGIQQKEFGIQIEESDQPDLKNIESIYQSNKGNFWIARIGEQVAGTIALFDIGNNEVALRKMFVYKNYRGKVHGVAQSLLKTAFDWCRKNEIRTIYLGTVSVLKAAHRFYEKNGFELVGKSHLPPGFQIMKVDTIFYKYSF